MKLLLISLLFISCSSQKPRINYEYKSKSSKDLIAGIGPGAAFICRKDSKKRKAKWQCITEQHKDYEAWEELAYRYKQNISKYIPSY